MSRREYFAQYREKNREEIRQRHREWRVQYTKNNRERLKQYHREYYMKNKGKQRKSMSPQTVPLLAEVWA